MGSRLESNSNAVRKRIEGHTFDNEEGDEYKGSKFGGFPEYFRRKKIKLQNLDAERRAHASDNPAIFRGIVAHVNGYTQPSLNDLHSMIVKYGGGFMQYLDGKTTVTHIIASNLTPKKIVEFRKYRIVKPAWVVDSIKAGKLLPWDLYRVVDEGDKQKVLQFDGGTVVSQVSKKSRSYRDQTDTSWYTSQLQLNASTQLATPGPSSAPKGDDQDPGVNSESFGSHDLDDLNLVGTAQDELDELSIDMEPAQPGKPSSRSMMDSFADLGDLDEEDMVEILALEEQQHVEDEEKPPGADDCANTACDHAVDHARHSTPDQPQQTLTPVSEPRRQTYDPPTDPEQTRPLVASPVAETTVPPSPDRSASLKRPASTSPTPPSAKKAKLTAEEHNAIILADPHVRKSSTLNPDFLEQYYRESRLHHLSTWKADLKSHLQALASEKSASQKPRPKRPTNARRYVLHVDFDSFFVAVSLKKHPQYKEKPACVAHGGGGTGSGGGAEIASCNYPARAFGVKNGMWMKRAHELCPELKVLPYDFPGYEAASRKFYEAMMALEGTIQSVSIDEALIDISATCLEAGGTDGTGVREGSIYREQAKADEIAQILREKVKAETGCEVSVGIGGNILLAKVALRKAKPAGQYQLKPEEVLSFIGELEVQSLPGVAYSIGGKLEEVGVKFVQDIREMSKEKLINILGPKTGEKMWNYARGIDRQEVGDVVMRKSVSAEVNWGVRFETTEQAEEFVESLCGELNKRLLKEGVKGKQLTMKIMRRAADAPLDPPKHLGHGKCDTFNKSVQLGVATNSTDVLAKEALSIMRQYAFSPGDLRGLGVQMQKLEPIKADLASSQRRLQFGVAVQRPVGAVASESPSKIQQASTPQAVPSAPPAAAPAQKSISFARLPQFRSTAATKPVDADIDLVESIEDNPVTPKKARPLEAEAVPSGIGNDTNSPSRRPLNILGTQFVMPTQVDPQVLAELPPDIRARLAKHIKPTTSAVTAGPIQQSSPSSRPISYTALPSHSQLDRETLEALPDDIRAEIIAHYETSPTKNLRGAQAVLPQSPRRNRTVAIPKKASTRGRPRGGGNTFLSRLKGAKANGTTLTQSNFVATTANTHRAGSHDATDSDTGDVVAERVTTTGVNEEFLAALPEDIRKEVLAQQRAEQLKRTGGLEVIRRRNALHAKQQKQATEASEQRNGERVLILPARAPRPSFTSRKLTALPELRDAVSDWFEEFSEDGPYVEDVGALGRYLRNVVVEEGNMGKALGVVRWMEWVIDAHNDNDDGEEEKLGDAFRSSIGTTGGTQGTIKWKEALETAKKHIRDAVKERGLGPVAL